MAHETADVPANGYAMSTRLEPGKGLAVVP